MSYPSWVDMTETQSYFGKGKAKYGKDKPIGKGNKGDMLSSLWGNTSKIQRKDERLEENNSVFHELLKQIPHLSNYPNYQHTSGSKTFNDCLYSDQTKYIVPDLYLGPQGLYVYDYDTKRAYFYLESLDNYKDKLTNEYLYFCKSYKDGLALYRRSLNGDSITFMGFCPKGKIVYVITTVKKNVGILECFLNSAVLSKIPNIDVSRSFLTKSPSINYSSFSSKPLASHNVSITATPKSKYPCMMHQKAESKNHLGSGDIAKTKGKGTSNLGTEIGEEDQADLQKFIAEQEESHHQEKNQEERDNEDYYQEPAQLTKDDSEQPMNQPNFNPAGNSIHNLCRKQEEMASNLNLTTEDQNQRLIAMEAQLKTVVEKIISLTVPGQPLPQQQYAFYPQQFQTYWDHSQLYYPDQYGIHSATSSSNPPSQGIVQQYYQP
jgi:hypothetical protein